MHLVCDNLGTHKTPAIRNWLALHPRFHLHLTPTGSSWINQVERWFGLLMEQLIRRGVHTRVADLENDVPANGSRTGTRTRSRRVDKDGRGHPPIPIEIYGKDLRRGTLVSRDAASFTPL